VRKYLRPERTASFVVVLMLPFQGAIMIFNFLTQGAAIGLGYERLSAFYKVYFANLQNGFLGKKSLSKF